MCQNSDGRLWIGTSDGISIYDGESFKNLTTEDGLASPLVNFILVDKLRKGIIWIGTNGGGLSRYEDDKFQTIRAGKTEASNRINSIAEDGSGMIWAATDRGIYFIKKRTAHKFKPGLFEDGVNTIAALGDDVIAPLHKRAVCFINTKSGAIQTLKLPLRMGEVISSISVDKDGIIWAGTSEGTLFKISGNSWKETKLNINTTILFAAKYKNNSLWVGTGKGIIKLQLSNLNKESDSILTKANGLPGSNINCGIIDSEGDLWLGFWNSGIAKLANENIYTFKDDFSSPIANNSKSIKDWYNHIWCIEEKGLLEIWKTPGGSIMKCFHQIIQNGSSDDLEMIKTDDHGRLIVGLNSGIICYYHVHHLKGRFSQLQKVLSLNAPYNHTFGNLLYIFPDNIGRLWCSINGVGVCSFYPFRNDKRIHLFVQKDGLPGKSIRVIYQDKQNHFWFGGFDKGLTEFTRNGLGKWKHMLFTQKDGLPDNSIRSITEDDSGRIWIGTRYGGIAIIHNNQIQRIDIRNGLLSNGVWCMAKESKASRIIGTQLGLQKLTKDGNGNHWSVLLSGQPVYSCGETGSGLVWASSEKNVTVINMKDKFNDSTPPNIFITGIFVNGSKIKLVNNKALSYNQNTLTFDFAGISLRYGSSLHYEYILNGADEAWHKINGRHTVTYALLRPGKYEFEVKAINPNGVMSIRPAIFALSIFPPIWLRWWFISSAVLAIAAGIFLIIRERVKNLLEIERVKGRIATDLHDDIGSGLTRIAIAADVALKQIEAAESSKKININNEQLDDETGYSIQSLIRKVGKHARELVDAMSDVVWSIDPKNTKLLDLLSHLRPYVFDICEAKDITLEFIVDDKILGMEINPESLRALLLIAKEASNNAVKHSDCRRLRIELSLEENKIKLTVMDDGKGFDITKSTQGYGLQNMQRRCSSSNGFLSVESSKAGTIITAAIPYK